MRVAIYGAGAMGTVLGAFLTDGGQPVDLISRNKAHVDGLRQNGAVVRCLADGVEKNVKVSALLPEQMQGEYDVIFLMTKQSKNPEILQFLKDYLADDGIVCTTQNGLPERSVAEALGQGKAYGAAVSFGANFVGGGVTELTSELSVMSVLFGGYQNDNAKNAALQEILSAAGRAIGNPSFARATENLAGARWSKLAMNAAFSTISTITGQTFGEIAKGRKTKRVALRILREAFAVAEASGVLLEPMQGHDLTKLFGGKGWLKTQVAYALLPIAMKRHKLLKSGMLKDIENGRRCDVDYVCGALVKAGEVVGVETPTASSAVQLVHGIENGLYEITPENIDFLQ